MAGSTPKIQHFDPCFYLRGFASDDCVRVYEKRPGENPPFSAQVRPIVRAAMEKYFYSLDTFGPRNHGLETGFFAPLDGLAARVISSIKHGYELRDWQWAGLKCFVAIMQGRGPRARQIGAEDFESDRNRVVQSFRETFGRDPDEDDNRFVEGVLRSALDVPGDVRLTSQNVGRLQIPELIRDRLRLFEGMHHCLITSTGRDFFTSDCPVTAFDPTNPPPAEGIYAGLDERSSSVEFTFPIDRRRALLLANVPMPEYVGTSNDGVRIVNSRVAFYSGDRIYAYPTDDPVAIDEELGDIDAFDRLSPLLPLVLDAVD